MSEARERASDDLTLEAAAYLSAYRAVFARLVDDEPCSLDHHGNCQTHNLGNPCEVAQARELLAAGERPARAGEAEAGALGLLDHISRRLDTILKPGEAPITPAELASIFANIETARFLLRAGPAGAGEAEPLASPGAERVTDEAYKAAAEILGPVSVLGGGLGAAVDQLVERIWHMARAASPSAGDAERSEPDATEARSRLVNAFLAARAGERSNLQFLTALHDYENALRGVRAAPPAGTFGTRQREKAEAALNVLSGAAPAPSGTPTP